MPARGGSQSALLRPWTIPGLRNAVKDPEAVSRFHSLACSSRPTDCGQPVTLPQTGGNAATVMTHIPSNSAFESAQPARRSGVRGETGCRKMECRTAGLTTNWPCMRRRTTNPFNALGLFRAARDRRQHQHQRTSSIARTSGHSDRRLVGHQQRRADLPILVQCQQPEMSSMSYSGLGPSLRRRIVTLSLSSRAPGRASHRAMDVKVSTEPAAFIYIATLNHEPSQLEDTNMLGTAIGLDAKVFEMLVKTIDTQVLCGETGDWAVCSDLHSLKTLVRCMKGNLQEAPSQALTRHCLTAKTSIVLSLSLMRKTVRVPNSG